MLLTKPHMILKHCLAILAILALVGCGKADIWDGHNPHHPRAILNTEVHYIQFQDDSDELDEWQQSILQKQLARHRFIRDITLLSCNDDVGLQDTRLLAVNTFLNNLGYTPEIVTNVSPQAIDDSTCVQVVVNYLYVITPNCPDLSHMNSTYGHISSNFGCAVGSAYGSMVNPNALLTEHGIDGVNAERAVLGIQKYFKAEQEDLASALTTAEGT